jgi:hypothetical protein
LSNVCYKCNLEKSIEEFTKFNKNLCRECRNAYIREWSKGLKRRKLDPIVNGYKQCQKCLEFKLIKHFYFRSDTKKYRAECKICYNNYKRKFTERDREKNKIRMRVYVKNNKKRLLKNKREIYKNKYSKDSIYKLRNSVKRNILHALKSSGGNKFRQSIMKYLPYTIEELKIHLESQFEPWMNWSNQGQYRLSSWDDNDSLTWKWQIDHIIPQSALPYTSMEDENFRKCWSLDNLRPLSAKENLIKFNKIKI